MWKTSIFAFIVFILSLLSAVKNILITDKGTATFKDEQGNVQKTTANTEFGATWVWMLEKSAEGNETDQIVSYVQAYDEMCRNGDSSESFCNSLQELRKSGDAYYALDTIGVFCASCAFVFSVILLLGHNLLYRGTYDEFQQTSGCKYFVHKYCVPSKHVLAYQIVIILFLFTTVVCLIASVLVFVKSYIPHLKQVSTDIFLYYFAVEAATMTWEKAQGGISVYLNVVAILLCFLAFIMLSCIELYRKDEMDNNDLTPFGQIIYDCKQCYACLTCRICRKTPATSSKVGDSHEYETPGDGSDDEDRKF